MPGIYTPLLNKIVIPFYIVADEKIMFTTLGHELIHYLQDASGLYEEDLKEMKEIKNINIERKLNNVLVKKPNLEFDSYLYENFFNKVNYPFFKLYNSKNLYNKEKNKKSKEYIIKIEVSTFIQQLFPYVIASKYGQIDLPKDLIQSLRVFVPNAIKYREYLAKELDKYNENSVIDLIREHDKYNLFSKFLGSLEKDYKGKVEEMIINSFNYLKRRNLELLDSKKEYVERMNSLLYKK
jgi:hypothetical protein